MGPRNGTAAARGRVDDLDRSEGGSTPFGAIADQDEELKVLAEKLLEALKASEGRGAEPPGIPAPRPSSAPADTLPIFLDIESKTRLVVSFPIGPRVDSRLMPLDDMANELSKDQNQARAQAIVHNANRLRKMADHAFPEASIRIQGLPNPDVAGYYAFWFEVLDQSLLKVRAC